MLTTILEKITERLETVQDLDVVYDIRQLEKDRSPIAIIHFVSQTPSGNDANWKFSTKYKSSVIVYVDLIHNSYFGLLELIEDVELAMKISEKLEGTVDWDYSGWSIEDPQVGSTIYGAQLKYTVVYIKTTT